MYAHDTTRRSTVLLLLCVTSGAIDAISFLRFNVFTSAMSGNTVLLGIAIGQRALQPAINSGTAFVGYFCGVALATRVRSLKNPGGNHLLSLLGLEVLFVAGFAALSVAHVSSAVTIIVLAGIGMGIQAVTARALNASGIITVVFTATLTSIAEALSGLLFHRPLQRLPGDAWRQIASFICYLGGASLGALFSLFGPAAAVLPLASVLAAFVIVASGPRGLPAR